MGAGYLKTIGYRETLDVLVVAFCKDYFHRKAAIAAGTTSRRTRMEYEYVNHRIAEAAYEIVGDEFENYIREIGESKGYAKSDVLDICESSYKNYKKEVKINVARKLHLLD